MSPIKKTLRHPKADEKARQSFQQKIDAYKAVGKPIIYIDESGFALDMPRTHGYSLLGKRCYGYKNWHAKGRINVIGALLGSYLLTTMLFECNIDSDVFHNWVLSDLLPKLEHPCVVVMDNASFHKRSDTREAIKNAGHTLEFLPPYSPDLNPIECKWAQAKSVRRRTDCSVEALLHKSLLRRICLLPADFMQLAPF